MAGTKSNSRTAIYIVLGVLVVAGLAGWSFASFRGGGSGGSAGGNANFSASVQGALVVAGNKNAPHTVDVYEDFICPFCARFESDHGANMAKAISDGKIQVRYHVLGFLNKYSNPAGYSLRAANAGVCAAEAGVFSAYHKKLFDEAPAEGSAGYSDQELIQKAKDVGAPASIDKCITSGKFTKVIASETERAMKDPSLKSDQGRFGTPRVTVDGKVVDDTDGPWLSDITK